MNKREVNFHSEAVLGENFSNEQTLRTNVRKVKYCTYIRFEDGQQVEATILATKPAGNDWKNTPQTFDFSKRYKLMVLEL
jgi:hypothetical protein